MGDNSPERKSACGLLNAVFGRRSIWPRKSTSTGSLPTAKGKNIALVKTPSTPNSKRRRNGSDDTNTDASFDSQPKTITRPPPNNPKPPLVYQQKQQQKHYVKPPEGPTASPQNQVYVNQIIRKVPKEAISISGELDSMIADHQKSKGTSTLVRASSSNVMLIGNLGNIRQPGGCHIANSNNAPDYVTKPAREESSMPNGKYTNISVNGNVGKKPNEDQKPKEEPPASLCRALSTRMDPETLKIMGNEDYKNGNFVEALALYDAAISLDPYKASYRSNKSAALAALGRLLEAVFECREAIQLDPHYHRAHHRLANLYLRLGEVEKAMYHYKHSGPESDGDDLAKAKALQDHLKKCTEAKKLRDWNTLIKETKFAVSEGADSAPQIYALQAEAFLKLHRHQDADEVLTKGPNFEVDACTKLFGPIGNANLLVVLAQVDMAVGRFDDALAAVQRAARLDANNREVNMVMRKARAVAAARSNGNELFKASRLSEASVAYGEGLEHDPYNSVLLCNRAACRSKLGQYEKAVDDCTAALNVRPGYAKARLRRADCNAKLHRWEAAIQDYEILKKESAEDEEVNQALFDAKEELEKQRGE
ncbi:TPR_1 domain-containing protein/TPR_2 domain-containing protein/TPR_11 domain-containing protein [Cephalotus follicularis]|uniref:TPR_1 domain-containing protein/TPR_2 domain-containing protein/TPR_11 domain-containing protein n=1 Tax=Cephalotus follicularis TaxID=3775 RepID=A0A1Q3DDP2_CEPFO|nr:TPR_1 domain-containing protein/TPR_2 domain-containing protein/TPR_11 domain-containing protein [Cephalotus follicularis]